MEQRINNDGRLTSPLPRRLAGLVLLAILAVTFLPWLGDTLFNTKGEPREALVAVSMMNSGNYVLPESYGADIPYKPPFLAWLIAGASHLTGGEVTEYSSRLPSAIATIAMVMAGFCFFSRRRGCGTMTALAASIVTVTTVEVYRAATACRVDMLLTACIVTAIYAMTIYRERHGHTGISWIAVGLMTLGVLTKGPVGAVIPCLVVWVYSLLRGDSLWRSTWTMAVSGTLSLLAPAVWYYAAWQEGGERFLRLALEENFGRMTGTMSYASHVNPWWYNIVTIVAGMLPYTLLALFALFTVRKIPKPAGWSTIMQKVREINPDTLLSCTAAVVIFVFYCIPESKRSVYLLPMYPFMAYLVTLLATAMARQGHIRVIGVYACLIAATGLIAAWIVWGLHMTDAASQLPDLSGAVADMARGLYDRPFGVADWVLLAVCIITCGATMCVAFRSDRIKQAMWGAMASALSVYWVLGATVLPRTLNAKSDIVLAHEIEKSGHGLPVYSFNAVKMLRYYTTAFYLGDKVRLFAPEKGSSQSVESTAAPELPHEGLLIVNTQEMSEWQTEYGDSYAVDTLYVGKRKSCDCRAVPMIVRFRDRHLSEAHHDE